MAGYAAFPTRPSNIDIVVYSTW